MRTVYSFFCSETESVFRLLMIIYIAAFDNSTFCSFDVTLKTFAFHCLEICDLESQGFPKACMQQLESTIFATIVLIYRSVYIDVFVCCIVIL